MNYIEIIGEKWGVFDFLFEIIIKILILVQILSESKLFFNIYIYIYTEKFVVCKCVILKYKI